MLPVLGAVGLGADGDGFEIHSWLIKLIRVYKGLIVNRLKVNLSHLGHFGSLLLFQLFQLLCGLHLR